MIDWQKPDRCTSKDCIEVGDGMDSSMILVRDSKDKTGDGTVLQFLPQRWETEVLEPIRNGTFDWSAFDPLRFTLEEQEAFTRGVLSGQFDLAKAGA